MHVSEQPSPLTALPSSQVSVPATTLSPHVVVHTIGGPTSHVYPASIMHVAEQPSPLTVPPSSQVSVPAITPSPHVVMHTLGEPVH